MGEFSGDRGLALVSCGAARRSGWPIWRRTGFREAWRLRGGSLAILRESHHEEAEAQEGQVGHRFTNPGSMMRSISTRRKAL
jgi:hypothetical protein